MHSDEVWMHHKATGQSNKKAPRPTSGKECPEGWQWSKGIEAKPQKGQAKKQNTY